MNNFTYTTKYLNGTSYNTIKSFTCIKEAVCSIYMYQKHPTKQAGIFATHIKTGKEKLIYATTDAYVYSKPSVKGAWFFGNPAPPGSIIDLKTDIQLHGCSRTHLKEGSYIVLQNTSSGCNLLTPTVTSLRTMRIQPKYFSEGVNLGTLVFTQEKITIYKKRNLWLFMNPTKTT